MRYLDMGSVEPNMILDKTVFNRNNEILLVRGSVTNENNIIRLKQQGIRGIFIADDSFEYSQVKSIVVSDLKTVIEKSLDSVFNSAADIASKKTYRKLNQILMKIVDRIIDSSAVFLNIADLRKYDKYTYSHSIDVAVYSIIIGYALGLGRSTLYDLGISGLLHDVGKKFIPSEILNKKSRLTDLEFELVRKHAEKGYRFLKERFADEINEKICLGVLHHHEKFDGTGYPYGLKEKNIPFYARIISVADVYDALISERSYHTAFLPSEALEYIMGSVGASFDPMVVNAFIEKVCIYPVGSVVRLSNGAVGVVVKNHNDCPLRPVIRCYDDQSVLNLKNDAMLRSVTITEKYDEQWQIENTGSS